MKNQFLENMLMIYKNALDNKTDPTPADTDRQKDLTT